MRKQTFQHAEIRDENDNIISNGAYGKNTALSNAQNDGWVDYVMNNIEWLYEKGKTYASTDELINRTKDLANKSSLIGLATTEYVDGRFTHLIGASAEALDTLEEIGKSLKNDADFAGTMTKELAKKADKGTVENALMGKAEKADVYTKQKVDNLLDKKMKAMIDILYPIGIVITTATDNTPKPGEAYGLAQWEEIGQNRVLQGCSTGAGSTIEAGLPNITGTATGAMWGSVNTERSEGAFRNTTKEGLNNSSNGELVEPTKWDVSKDGIRRCSAFFDASKSNGIYGKSNTVQPPALTVHFWKRIS